ncbi:MAG: CapA family protein [Clostridia bacterium]|nr:CapA family protein [Clostridia bacterium]
MRNYQYSDNYTQQNRSSKADAGKNIFAGRWGVAAAAGLLAINILLTVLGVTVPGKDVSEHNNEVKIPITSSTDIQQPTPPEEEKLPDTAYGKIVPAQGDYSDIIDRFVSYERSQMRDDEIVLSFTGDCTLGTWPTSNAKTNYTAVFEESGSPTYSFDNVKSLFFNDDYTYINLETTLTDSKTVSQQKYAFKGSPDWGSTMIAPSGVEGCNIANNHHYDWLEEGYTDTIDSVTSAGMDVGNEDHVIVTTCGDIEIVLISGNYIWPTGRGKTIDSDTLTAALCAQVKQYKRQDNIVIVNAHWGLERKNYCNGSQVGAAHALIDAGADMVVGHHPHTLQGVEYYNGKYIFYSLGNFAFGGKGTTDEVNRMAVILRPRFALRDGSAQLTGLSIVPCYTTSSSNVQINNYQPRPLSGDEAADIADKLIKYSSELKYGITSRIDCPTAEY